MKEPVFLKRLVFVKWIVFGLFLVAGNAQANLLITPTRVVFDERNRNAEVTLLNASDTTKVYQILWKEMQQTSDGGYRETVDSTDEHKTASSMIRHSPRKVTIEPGKYQRIKLRYRMPTDLADGEYRSHLMMKVTDVGNDLSGLTHEGKGAKLMLIPKLSFTIPILVRKGEVNPVTDIAGVTLNTQNSEGPKLVIDVSRTGMHSSYGKIFAYMKATHASQVQKIGEVHNIALFPETTVRTVKMPLQVKSVPPGAILQVVYEGDDEFEGQQLGTAAFTYKP
mgnify:CR=1 FL=1